MDSFVLFFFLNFVLLSSNPDLVAKFIPTLAIESSFHWLLFSFDIISSCGFVFLVLPYFLIQDSRLSWLIYLLSQS